MHGSVDSSEKLEQQNAREGIHERQNPFAYVSAIRQPLTSSGWSYTRVKI